MLKNRIKLLILSDPGSPHTIKWVKSLAEKNIDVLVFGLSKYNKEEYAGYQNIHIYSFGLDNSLFAKDNGSLSKIIYMKNLFGLKKIIKEFQPDIIHAHYASSYGFFGALTGFHPYIISVWGSDIFSFPQKSFIHKSILKFNLAKADRILSTSKIMAEEVKKYSAKEITVVPFGIDTDKFKPVERESIFKKDEIVTGTIKSLEEPYGIEYLIRAFKLVKEKLPGFKLKLLIVGKGSKEEEYKKLAIQLNLKSDIVFTGYIRPEEIPIYHNMIDIFTAVSLQESFGVAVLEASACGKPVIVSDAGGLKEVAIHNVTGLAVPSANVNETALALEKLILSKELRETMGNNGREFVIKNYNWNSNVDSLLNVYEDLLNS